MRAFSTSPSDVVHRFGVGAGRDFDAARQCEALCMSMSPVEIIYSTSLIKLFACCLVNVNLFTLTQIRKYY